MSHVDPILNAPVLPAEPCDRRIVKLILLRKSFSPFIRRTLRVMVRRTPKEQVAVLNVAVLRYLPHHSISPNAKTFWPAAIVTYCLPSNT